MIRRSPDLMLVIIVITVIGTIATNIAYGASNFGKSTHSQEIHSAYVGTLNNQQDSSLSLSVGQPELEHLFQRVELVLGKPRYTYAITLQFGLTYQGTGFDLNMGEAKLKAPLYKAFNENNLEQASRYGFFGLEVAW
ncbi:MAG: hypothetical protein GXP14_08785 [Gammaproteobacteria bacterium]|nr:hypothetical protein [Gammaproteobacteria bacterium]